MSLTNTGVRIVISEPFEWTAKNLFGTITSQRENALYVKLTQPLSAKGVTGDTLELRPRFKEDTISSLPRHYSLSINGALVGDGIPEPVFVLIGTVTVD